MIIVADHGNAEELLDASGKPKTAHTTNKVPCIICDDTDNRKKYQVNDLQNPGLSNLAATIAMICGVECPQGWNPSLIKIVG